MTNVSFYSEIGTQVMKNISSSVKFKMSGWSRNNLCTSLISFESSSKLSLTETLLLPLQSRTRDANAIKGVASYRTYLRYEYISSVDKPKSSITRTVSIVVAIMGFTSSCFLEADLVDLTTY